MSKFLIIAQGQFDDPNTWVAVLPGDTPQPPQDLSQVGGSSAGRAGC